MFDNIKETFDNAKDCATKLSLNASAICACCLGKGNIYDANKVKLYFKYLEPTDDLINMKIDKTNLKSKKYKKIKKINIYDKDMNLIDTCDSCTIASKKYKTTRKTIHRRCIGKDDSPIGDHYFKYA